MRLHLLAFAVTLIVALSGMPVMAETLSSYREAANAELTTKAELERQ